MRGEVEHAIATQVARLNIAFACFQVEPHVRLRAGGVRQLRDLLCLCARACEADQFEAR